MAENIREEFHKRQGIFFMLVSALCFAFMGGFVKAAGNVPLFQKVLFRNLVIVILIAFPLVKLGPSGFWGHPGNRRFLILRSFTGLAGVILFFFSLESLNLGDASMLNKLSPFFVILFSFVFLKHKIKAYQIPALLCAFGGALLIIKPRWDLTMLPALAGIGASVTAGLSYTLISFLKGKEHPNTVIFWFSGISMLFMLPPALLQWHRPGGLEWVALLGTGICAAGGQYFLTRAYQQAPPGEVSIYSYSQIIFSILLGILFFAEIPDGLSLAGAGIIIAVAVFLYRAGRGARNPELRNKNQKAENKI